MVVTTQELDVFSIEVFLPCPGDGGGDRPVIVSVRPSDGAIAVVVMPDA